VEDWPAPWEDACSSTDSQARCLACGACCASFRVSFYWSESDEATDGSVPAEMTCQVAPLLCAMKGTDQPRPRCIALQGTVGVRVRCAIYDRRPSVCCEVGPSGHGGRASPWCDHARAIWGLPSLMPVPVGGKEEKW
jgi:Fe-S-cluster containining protein